MKCLNYDGLVILWGKIMDYVTGLGYYTKPSGGIPANDIASGVIPSAPGTLNTTATTSQTTSTSEALSGNITLHKVAKTGSNTDLVDAPQYVITTLAAYNAMASHDADTYYLIIADNA